MSSELERQTVPKVCKDIGCKKLDGNYCITYNNPQQWWQENHPYFGRCPIPIIAKEVAQQLKLNPLKLSKLKMMGGLVLGYRFRKYARGSGKRKRYIEGAVT